MKKQSIFLILGMISTLILNACGERKNPLDEKHPLKLAFEIKKLNIEGVPACSPALAYPEKSTQVEVSACEKLFPEIAARLNAINYTDKKILPQDFNKPSLWQVYLKRHASAYK